MMLILVTVTLTNCVPSRKICEKNYGPCGYIEEKTDTVYKEVKVDVPGSTITVEVPKTIFVPRETPGKNDTIYVKDKQGIAEIKFYYDQKTGKYMAECEAKEREYLTKIAEINKQKSKIVYVPEQDKRKGIFIPNWALYTICILAILLVLVRVIMRFGILHL